METAGVWHKRGWAGRIDVTSEMSRDRLARAGRACEIDGERKCKVVDVSVPAKPLGEQSGDGRSIGGEGDRVTVCVERGNDDGLDAGRPGHCRGEPEVLGGIDSEVLNAVSRRVNQHPLI